MHSDRNMLRLCVRRNLVLKNKIWRMAWVWKWKIINVIKKNNFSEYHFMDDQHHESVWNYLLTKPNFSFQTLLIKKVVPFHLRLSVLHSLCDHPCVVVWDRFFSIALSQYKPQWEVEFSDNSHSAALNILKEQNYGIAEWVPEGNKCAGFLSPVNLQIFAEKISF